MKKILKRTAAVVGGVPALAVLAVAGLVAFLSVTEYMPEAVETASYIAVNENSARAETDKTFTVYSWNTGYGGLGEESDFFMDGGKMVDPPSAEAVQKNLDGILAFMEGREADAWLLQEVDVDSDRTGNLDQYALYADSLDMNSAFAYNYKCPFVPIPLPPLGQIEAGIATFTSVEMSADAQRISLPCPFEWPVRAANMKRCLLTTRIPLEGSDKELVLVNLHLEAYDDGEGKLAQTNLLLQVLQEEYEKGNYVIAGGDFNQSFPGVLDRYPIADPSKWTPGILEDGTLPEGWQFAYDAQTPTCRLLDQPYCEDCQLYVIDGFILSPNVRLTSVETVDLDFAVSDHNPVCLKVTLE